MGSALNHLVYTVNTGGYDRGKPIPVECRQAHIRYVYCTDDLATVPEGWEPFVLQREDLPPRHLSRLPKCDPAGVFGHLPWWRDIRYSIYIDASFHIQAPLGWLVPAMLPCDVAAFAHYGGHIGYLDEREHYMRVHERVPRSVQRQCDRMAAAEINPGVGVWACGLIVRRHPDADWLGRQWLACYMTGSNNDQLAFIEAVEDCAVSVKTLPGSVMTDAGLAWEVHAR